MTLASFEVSVIIPAYNAAHTLGRALDSVLRQSLPARQILVIDDGSTDDLSRLKQRFADRVQWHHQSNRGAAATRNTGIDRAAYPLVAFLDADDYWQSHKLEHQVACYRQHPQLGLTCSDYFERRPGESPKETRRWYRRRPIVNQPVQLQGRAAFDAACGVWTGTVMVPRHLLDAHRFYSGIEPAEDRDLWFRLLQVAPSLYLPEVLATAVLEPNSLSRTQVDRDCANMLRVIERASTSLGWRGTRWWKARTYRRWASEYLGQGRGAAAVGPAWRRLQLQPWSLQAWWIQAKSVSLAINARQSGQSDSKLNSLSDSRSESRQSVSTNSLIHLPRRMVTRRSGGSP